MFIFHQPLRLAECDAVRRLTAIPVVDLSPLASGKFNFLDTEAMEADGSSEMVSKGHSLVPSDQLLLIVRMACSLRLRPNLRDLMIVLMIGV